MRSNSFQASERGACIAVMMVLPFFANVDRFWRSKKAVNASELRVLISCAVPCQVLETTYQAQL